MANTRDEVAGHLGMWQREYTYHPNGDAPTDGSDGKPPAYWQFLANVISSSPRATRHIIPLPVLTPGCASQARSLGGMGWRPNLVFLNPPRAPSAAAASNLTSTSAHFHNELAHAWAMVRCGGTLAGDAYLLATVQKSVDKFATQVNATVEAGVVHAPGTKYEVFRPEVDTCRNEKKACFSVWIMRNKTCASSLEDELPSEQENEAADAGSWWDRFLSRPITLGIEL
eukprot:2167806-Prymnesium_polylepis.1